MPPALMLNPPVPAASREWDGGWPATDNQRQLTNHKNKKQQQKQKNKRHHQHTPTNGPNASTVATASTTQPTAPTTTSQTPTPAQHHLRPTTTNHNVVAPTTTTPTCPTYRGLRTGGRPVRTATPPTVIANLEQADRRKRALVMECFARRGRDGGPATLRLPLERLSCSGEQL